MRCGVSHSGQPQIASIPAKTNPAATTPATSFTIRAEGGFCTQRFILSSQTGFT
jgi:hypothetical protein